MKKLFSALMVVVLLTIGLTASAIAATDGTVNATVTAQSVSISLSDASVAYGTLSLGATAATPTPASITATNNGNVTENFAVRGADTTDWALGGTAGADIYVHRASIDAFITPVVLTTTNQPLATNVAASGSETVSLNLDMPTSSASFAQQTAAVTIVASAS